MRVTKHDDICIVSSRQLCRRWTSHFVAVTDVQPDTVNCNDDFFAQSGLTRRIGVAQHSLDGRNQPELVKNVGAADVSGVKNELDPRQRPVHAGPQKPVRIGDESHNVRFGV